MLFYDNATRHGWLKRYEDDVIISKNIGDECKEDNECDIEGGVFCKNGICEKSSETNIGQHCEEDEHCVDSICHDDKCRKSGFQERCRDNEECYFGNNEDRQLYCIKQKDDDIYGLSKENI